MSDAAAVIDGRIAALEGEARAIEVRLAELRAVRELVAGRAVSPPAPAAERVTAPPKPTAAAPGPAEGPPRGKGPRVAGDSVWRGPATRLLQEAGPLTAKEVAARLNAPLPSVKKCLSLACFVAEGRPARFSPIGTTGGTG